MKKELILSTAIAFFVIAYVLDQLVPPIPITAANPYAFINSTLLSTYPLSAFSIILKTAGIWVSILVAISTIENKYFAKATFLFLLAAISQLYSIQQFTAKIMAIPIDWTLAVSFAGLFLTLPIVWFLARGLLHLVNPPLQTYSSDDSSSDDDDDHPTPKRLEKFQRD